MFTTSFNLFDQIFSIYQMAILANSDVAIYHAVLLHYHSQMLVSFYRQNQLNHPAARNPIHLGPQTHCLAPRTQIPSMMYNQYIDLQLPS